MTDHNKVTTTEDEKILTRIRQRWDNFDINVQYISGKLNEQADTMSRYGITEEKDGCNQPHKIKEEITTLYAVETLDGE